MGCSSAFYSFLIWGLRRYYILSKHQSLWVHTSSEKFQGLSSVWLWYKVCKACAKSLETGCTHTCTRTQSHTQRHSICYLNLLGSLVTLWEWAFVTRELALFLISMLFSGDTKAKEVCLLPSRHMQHLQYCHVQGNLGTLKRQWFILLGMWEREGSWIMWLCHL